MSPRLRRRDRPVDRHETLPAPPAPAGLVLDARLHLLDRQVIDRGGDAVAVLDDLELAPLPGDPAVLVGTHLLSGPVLVTRIFGGRPPRGRLHRIRWAHVTDVGAVVRLGVPGEELDVLWVERWLREHVIGQIPGGRHDPQ